MTIRIPMTGDNDPLEIRPAAIRWGNLRSRLEKSREKVAFRRGDPNSAQTVRDIDQMLDDLDVLRNEYNRRMSQ